MLISTFQHSTILIMLMVIMLFERLMCKEVFLKIRKASLLVFVNFCMSPLQKLGVVSLSPIPLMVNSGPRLAIRQHKNAFPAPGNLKINAGAIFILHFIVHIVRYFLKILTFFACHKIIFFVSYRQNQKLDKEVFSSN